MAANNPFSFLIFCLFFTSSLVCEAQTYLVVMKDSVDISVRFDSPQVITLFSTSKGDDKVKDSVKISQQSNSTEMFPGINVQFYIDGVVKQVAYYSNFRLNGNCLNLSEDGKLIEIIPFDNGTMNGTYMKYYQSGYIQSKVEYVMGLKEGIETIYSSDGKVMFETEFKNGKRNGKRKVYLYNNGNLTIEEEYSDDKKNGVVKRYYRSGSIAAIKHYINDTAEGEFIFYNRFGLRTRQYDYRQGALINKKVYFLGIKVFDKAQ